MHKDGRDNVTFLEIKGVKKYFTVHAGMHGKKKVLKAVDGVNCDVEKDTTFAIVGESGCGKSTLARMIVRLLEPTSGEILFNGVNIFKVKGASLKEFRRNVQIVFQDPYASLNPRMRILSALAEPLKIHGLSPKKEVKERVADLLVSVGLTRDAMDKYPHEFSGGQRQRICIARALSLSPELIVADEPLSALDVSIQAQILNLLKDLKERIKISFIFISHDLNVVHYFSDVTAVMYLGKIVEQAPTEELFARPFHPYTELLLNSAPKIHDKPEKPGQYMSLNGGADVPSPVDIPTGCPFHPRCPKRFSPCSVVIPALRDKNGHLVGCLLYE